MSLEIPISNRARQWGYVFWPKENDDEMKRLLGKKNEVEVRFDDSSLGSKKVDWTHRRISVGWKRTRNLPSSVKVFRLSMLSDGRLKITCQ